MKPIIYAIVFIGILSVSLSAQNVKSKAVALPAGIAGWSGEYSDKLLNDPVIKTRLKKLLGSKNYESFIESFETLTPIVKDGNILFASGCLIHACTHLESAIAINVRSNTIYAAIFNDEKPTRFFNERGSKPPKPIVAWAKNLNAIKVNK